MFVRGMLFVWTSSAKLYPSTSDLDLGNFDWFIVIVVFEKSYLAKVVLCMSKLVRNRLDS